MKIFISYSRDDLQQVKDLVDDLENFDHEVWFDQELTGGQEWWSNILHNICSCELFIAALSSAWLASNACELEFKYAQAVNRLILPVNLEPIRFKVLSSEIQQLQIVDYSNSNRDNLKKLVRAINKMVSVPPLPDVMPTPPSAPVSQLSSIATQLRAQSLSADEQTNMLLYLERLLDNPKDFEDAIELINQLKKRPDVIWRVVVKINNLLSQFDETTGKLQSAEVARTNRNQIKEVELNARELIEVGKSKVKFDTLGFLSSSQKTVQLMGLSLPTFSSEASIEIYQELLSRGVTIQIIIVNPLSPALNERPNKLYNITQNVRIIAANSLRTLSKFHESRDCERGDLFQLQVINILPTVGITRCDEKVLWYPYFVTHRGAISPYLLQNVQSVFGSFITNNFVEVWNNYSYKIEGLVNSKSLLEILEKDTFIFNHVDQINIDNLTNILDKDF